MLIIVHPVVFLNDLISDNLTILQRLLCFNSTLILFLKLPYLFIEQLHQFLIFPNNLFTVLTLLTCRHAATFTNLMFSLFDFHDRKMVLIIIERIVFTAFGAIFNYWYNEGKVYIRNIIIFHFLMSYFIS